MKLSMRVCLSAPHIGWWCALVALVADQASKQAVGNFLRLNSEQFGHRYPVFSWLSLTPVYNYGISFGWFSASRGALNTLLLAAVALLVCTQIYAIMRRADAWPSRVGCGLVLGGAAGNLIDRIVLGAVFDFIDVHAFGFRFWTFNVADAAITLGAALLFFVSFVQRKSL